VTNSIHSLRSTFDSELPFGELEPSSLSTASSQPILTLKILQTMTVFSRPTSTPWTTNSLSASSLPPSEPNQTTPFVCSYVPRGPPSGPTTYSLPTTPESNLSFATKLSFAKDSMLAKLGLVSSTLLLRRFPSTTSLSPRRSHPRYTILNLRFFIFVGSRAPNPKLSSHRGSLRRRERRRGSLESRRGRSRGKLVHRSLVSQR